MCFDDGPLLLVGTEELPTIHSTVHTRSMDFDYCLPCFVLIVDGDVFNFCFRVCFQMVHSSPSFLPSSNDIYRSSDTCLYLSFKTGETKRVVGDAI
mmetsp:Transcript_62657/g.152529  ORF Transcript_62657/g.152529 Transcript_62657/m.152529 type:complete len:96 (+) Transcript_62657:130-417(+)